MGWVTWDGHMEWPHGKVTPDGSYRMVKVSSSFKTGGYYQNVWYTNIRQNFKNTSHGNAIFSGLTYASNLIPICVKQACPGVQYLCSSIWTQSSRSYCKSAPKLVEQNEGTTYNIVTYVSEGLTSQSHVQNICKAIFKSEYQNVIHTVTFWPQL